MKNKLFDSFCCYATVALSIAIVIGLNKSDCSMLSDNVEALATPECVEGKISCLGEGSLYCRLDNKSEYGIVIVEEYQK